MTLFSARSRAVLLAAAVGVLTLLASFYGFFFFRDNFSTHYPIKALSAASFRAGEIPYWNFADAGGQPLAGNPNTLTFYPDNILYVLFPEHVAFNLHFLLHLILGWFVMRELVETVLRERHSAAVQMGRSLFASSAFAATVYVLSGMVITATAFYNLVTAVALIPLALLAAERRSSLLLGTAFGLLMLGTEPVTILGAGIAVLIVTFDRLRIANLAGSAVIAAVIASPQLIAYSEIASEVERAHGFSAKTILNTSLEPLRLAEMIAGPLFRSSEPRLFLSLFIGVIVIPALFQRSRYLAVAGAMLFLALGRFNPIAAEILPFLRIARYPEKFVMPLVAAMMVLVGIYFDRTPFRRTWLVITLLPLIAWAVVTLPVDWFAPYRLESGGVRYRVAEAEPGGQAINRDEYRARALRLEPLFGATAGIRYVLNGSGDGMHSLLTRIAVERFAETRSDAYPRIAAGPRVSIVSAATGVGSVNEAVALLEAGRRGIVPRRYDGFVSSPDARVLHYAESLQAIAMTVSSSAPALLLVNQTFFSAWTVEADGRSLPILPVDIDRLGVIVPAGRHELILRFGRHRTLILAAWIASWLVLIASLYGARQLLLKKV